MLSVVVLPERGAMNAAMCLPGREQGGPRPDAAEVAEQQPGIAAAAPAGRPGQRRRQPMAVFAAGTGVSGAIRGLTASAATGSRVTGARRRPSHDDARRDRCARQRDGDDHDQDGGRAGATPGWCAIGRG